MGNPIRIKSSGDRLRALVNTELGKFYLLSCAELDLRSANKRGVIKFWPKKLVGLCEVLNDNVDNVDDDENWFS